MHIHNSKSQARRHNHPLQASVRFVTHKLLSLQQSRATRATCTHIINKSESKTLRLIDAQCPCVIWHNLGTHTQAPACGGAAQSLSDNIISHMLQIHMHIQAYYEVFRTTEKHFSFIFVAKHEQVKLCYHLKILPSRSAVQQYHLHKGPRAEVNKQIKHTQKTNYNPWPNLSC